jgi:hypothetical protein
MRRVTSTLRGKSFEVFTAVKIQVEVFWVVTQCNVVLGYQSFGSPCCLLGSQPRRPGLEIEE